MRSVLIPAAAGAIVALAAHEIGALLIALSLVVVLVGLLFTLTAIGAVIGIPLMFAGALGVALGLASLAGTGSAIMLGLIAGLAIYALVRRHERRAAL